MFDIGFWEVLLIAVVALLVVGPDRLPALARTVGLWVGKIRRMVAQVKDDVERELRADEIRRMLDKPEEFDDVEKSLKETQESLNEASHELSRSATDADPKTEEPASPAAQKASVHATREPAAESSRKSAPASDSASSDSASRAEGADDDTSARRRAGEGSGSGEAQVQPRQDSSSVTSSDDGDQTSRV